MTHPFDTFFLLALGQKLPDVKATAADEADVHPSPPSPPPTSREVLPCWRKWHTIETCRSAEPGHRERGNWSALLEERNYSRLSAGGSAQESGGRDEVGEERSELVE